MDREGSGSAWLFGAARHCQSQPSPGVLQGLSGRPEARRGGSAPAAQRALQEAPDGTEIGIAPMKVGLVVRHFNPARGGAERWTHELARRALAAGHEVHVVAQSFGPPEHALPIVPQKIPRLHSPFAFAQAIDEALGNLDLDLVHDMGFGWRFDILQPHFGAPRAQFDRKLLSMPGWKRTFAAP